LHNKSRPHKNYNPLQNKEEGAFVAPFTAAQIRF
jgi:hypothetical protein